MGGRVGSPSLIARRTRHRSLCWRRNAKAPKVAIDAPVSDSGTTARRTAGPAFSDTATVSARGAAGDAMGVGAGGAAVRPGAEGAAVEAPERTVRASPAGATVAAGGATVGLGLAARAAPDSEAPPTVVGAAVVGGAIVGPGTLAGAAVAVGGATVGLGLAARAAPD
jgi:hypothetical protein